jgi:hypothetical protein
MKPFQPYGWPAKELQDERAAEKIRATGLVAGAMDVFMLTDGFATPARQRSASVAHRS